MKIPTNDESFDSEEIQAFTREREIEELTRQSRPKPNPIVNCFVSCIAYVQYFWIHHRAETILGLILFGSVTLAVTGTIEAYELEKHHHQKKTHSIQHDYSDVKSAVELKLGKVDHWCLDGGDKNCARCDDPTKAVHRMDNRMWGHALAANTKDVHALVEQRADVDVVFLGDQNVEARAGRWYGGNGSFKKDSESKKGGRFWDNTDIPELLRKSSKKFNKYFDKPSTEGAKYKGVAMGISGDTSPNLLWRIQNSETLTLQPKVWWVNIGINDLIATSCSEEITLLGILRVVEELMMKKDGSTIVINSILPISTRSDLKLEGKNTRNKFWTSAKLINERLKRFAKKNPGVKFYDATPIVTVNRGHKTLMRKAMFVDKFHLSAEGQEALAQEQAAVIESILKSRDKKASYRDAPTSPTTDAEAKMEQFEDGEDDLYGYPKDEFNDDFLDINW